ncbi:MAG TPA: DNA-3-methyladenine glycosylase 2 [Burkholderiales bacterium]|jgi:AraC family transcriptional regulator of adaptative response / DNA-3-methyladenine glycosylase II|nr:DNA-3-methyladenine glycosylase 2 [Burkholderiales bacterium]
MTLDLHTCYRALRSRDARFDGRFFVAVSSTRIYCRPVCTVKPPKRENCRFYPSAAAAESAGYRPCLRCRPELAPGNASVDATRRVAQAAASLIEDHALEEGGLDAIAGRLGITDRHLRRAFGAEFGVSPVEFAQTQRLLLAKRLLTDTALPVTEVAYASGFGSLRRFNALFKQRYRLQPSMLRRHMRTRERSTGETDTLSFELSFRPPYDWAAVSGFLGARSIAGVEAVEDECYRRTARVTADGKEHVGWLEIGVSAKKPALRVAVSASLARALPPVLSRVKALMDLSCNPTEVSQTLGALARRNPGLRVPGAFDGFEVAVRAIVGQQVSVAAARTIVGRLATAFGDAIDTPFATLRTIFPAPERIADATQGSVARLGMPGSRARTLIALARAVADGTLVLAPNADVESTLERLRALAGVGEWTAQYIAMRALAWPDAFPHTDLGVMKALRETDPRRVLEVGEGWRPWRAYAVMHLWQSLRKD